MANSIPAYRNISILKKAFEPLNYTFRDLEINNHKFTQFKSKSGQVWLVNNSKIQYPFPSNSTNLITKSKIISAQLVKQFGKNTPYTEEVSVDEVDTYRPSSRMLAYESIIVKPSDSTMSLGLTLNIADPSTLKKALLHALKYSSAALVQEQVFGSDLRFMAVDGGVQAVLHRQPPRVVGDGKSTIEQLIIAENAARQTLTLPYGQYYRELNQDNVESHLWASQEVPAAGEVVQLSSSVLVTKGATVDNVIDDIDPSYIRAAEDLAKVMGSGILSVDIIVKDYKVPLEQNNYWFIEFNNSPAIGLNYCVRDGNHFDVLSYLVPKIEKAIS